VSRPACLCACSSKTTTRVHNILVPLVINTGCVKRYIGTLICICVCMCICECVCVCVCAYCITGCIDIWASKSGGEGGWGHPRHPYNAQVTYYNYSYLHVGPLVMETIASSTAAVVVVVLHHPAIGYCVIRDDGVKTGRGAHHCVFR